MRLEEARIIVHEEIGEGLGRSVAKLAFGVAKVGAKIGAKVVKAGAKTAIKGAKSYFAKRAAEKARGGKLRRRTTKPKQSKSPRPAARPARPTKPTRPRPTAKPRKRRRVGDPVFGGDKKPTQQPQRPAQKKVRRRVGGRGLSQRQQGKVRASRGRGIAAKALKRFR